MRQMYHGLVLLVLCSCPVLAEAREHAGQSTVRCDVVTKTVVDSVIQEDDEYWRKNENTPRKELVLYGDPINQFLLHLQNNGPECAVRQLARALFLFDAYGEMVLPFLVKSFLLAVRNRVEIVWDDDLCGALEGIYELKADELIQPLAKEGFTYDVVSKRCLFGAQ